MQQFAKGEIEDLQQAETVELAEEEPEVSPELEQPVLQQPEEQEQPAKETEAKEGKPIETEAQESSQPKEQLQEEGEKPVDDAVSEEEQHEAILLEIFVNEAQGHLKTIDEFVAATRAMAPLYKAPPLSLQRALHTLKGTAEMADFSELGQLVEPLEAFIKELYHHQICLDEDIVQLVEDGAAFFRSILDSMTDGGVEVGGGLAMYRARLAELRDKAVGHLLSRGEGDGSGKDFSAVKKLMADGLLSLQNYDQLYAHLQRQTAPPRVVFSELLSDLDDIQQKLADSEIEPVLELSQLMAGIYQQLKELGKAPSPEVWELMEGSHELLLNLFDMLAADQDLQPLEQATKQNLSDLGQQLASQLEEKRQFDQAQLEQERAAAELQNKKQTDKEKAKKEQAKKEQPEPELPEEMEERGRKQVAET